MAEEKELTWQEQVDLDILTLGLAAYTLAEAFKGGRSTVVREKLKEMLERRGVDFTNW